MADTYKPIPEVVPLTPFGEMPLSDLPFAMQGATPGSLEMLDPKPNAPLISEEDAAAVEMQRKAAMKEQRMQERQQGISDILGEYKSESKLKGGLLAAANALSDLAARDPRASPLSVLGTGIQGAAQGVADVEARKREEQLAQARIIQENINETAAREDQQAHEKELAGLQASAEQQAALATADAPAWVNDDLLSKRDKINKTAEIVAIMNQVDPSKLLARGMSTLQTQAFDFGVSLGGSFEDTALGQHAKQIRLLKKISSRVAQEGLKDFYPASDKDLDMIVLSVLPENMTKEQMRHTITATNEFMKHAEKMYARGVQIASEYGSKPSSQVSKQYREDTVGPFDGNLIPQIDLQGKPEEEWGPLVKEYVDRYRDYLEPGNVLFESGPRAAMIELDASDFAG